MPPMVNVPPGASSCALGSLISLDEGETSLVKTRKRLTDRGRKTFLVSLIGCLVQELGRTVWL